MPARALAVRSPFGAIAGLFRTPERVPVPAWRHRVLGSWVAALLNPLFAFNDHAVMPERWTEFLALRLLVSATIVLLLLGR